ncbi:MAG: glycosyltransferase, partial [Anaerolineales bacterium]|nr:glycosyltransferase [Anaerolineales bacterium]
MSCPSVSLVTPCFNHADFVGDTIESVVSQDYPNLEYIVINDGSTDESDAVIKRYADQLHHWETWPGSRPGPAPAINRGFSFSNGEIMG